MSAENASQPQPLLRVSGLTVESAQGHRVVDDVSFTIDVGETVALVGESGSGKSLTARAIASLLPNGLTARGSILWKGHQADTRSLRGSEISMLLQDPFTQLNPLAQVRRTMAETLDGRGRAVQQITAARIAEVGLDEQTLRKYPWELSGGMRQRVGLAAALTRRPDLLIADEPTTALDATTQRDVLRLIHGLQHARHMALLLITHDLRVAMSMSDRVLVMSQGKIIEAGTSQHLKEGGEQPYTRELWAAELPVDRRLADLRVETRLAGAPSVSQIPPGAHANEPILEARNLRKRFAGRTRRDNEVWALRGVDFEVRSGRSLGVIGESGSGKTTLARCLLGLEQVTSGEIHLPGDAGWRDEWRHRIQCVFQDPYSSLNPSHSIGFTLREALRHRQSDAGPRPSSEEVTAMLASVGLPEELLRRRPHALSGGQRQRVAIARGLLLRPRILVCDEPVAALDLTVQSQVLQILRDAQASGLSMVFITHDVSVARQMTDDLIVLYQGEIVESGETATVLDAPEHPYTKRLLGSVPSGDRRWLDEGAAKSRTA